MVAQQNDLNAINFHDAILPSKLWAAAWGLSLIQIFSSFVETLGPHV